MDPVEIAIGIDLGTTNCRVGVWRNNVFEMIANEKGETSTPSVVTFTSKQITVGDPSAQGTVVCDIKRLLGRNYSDAFVQENLKYWPYVVCGKNDRPYIQVDEYEMFAPEEITAMILHKMKRIAEKYLGFEVKRTVITVPSSFYITQRTSLSDAAHIADLHLLRIANETTSAALFNGFEKKIIENILVFQLGCTLDVSIVAIDEGIFEVKAVTGNTQLGGNEFVNRMVLYYIKEFQTKYEIDISQNKQVIKRLWNACERAKCELSFSKQATIELDSLDDNIKLFTTITREQFEEMNMDLFQECIHSVHQTLKEAKILREEIHELFLVGGSTCIPKLQDLLKKFFENTKIKITTNEDKSAALFGASVYAAILSGNKDKKISEILLLDCNSHSLGIASAGGLMSYLCPKNTCIPWKGILFFTTYVDNQHSFNFKIYEGENSMVGNNKLVHKIKVSGLMPTPALIPRIEITFDINANGTDWYSVGDRTGRYKITWECVCDFRLTPDELYTIIKKAYLQNIK